MKSLNSSSLAVKNCAPESKHAPPNRLLASLPPIDEDFSTICVLILWLSKLSPALQPASPAPIINTSTCCKIGAQGFFLNELLHLTEQKRTSSQHLLHFFRHVKLLLHVMQVFLGKSLFFCITINQLYRSSVLSIIH